MNSSVNAIDPTIKDATNTENKPLYPQIDYDKTSPQTKQNLTPEKPI